MKALILFSLESKMEYVQSVKSIRGNVTSRMSLFNLEPLDSRTPKNVYICGYIPGNKVESLQNASR